MVIALLIGWFACGLIAVGHTHQYFQSLNKEPICNAPWTLYGGLFGLGILGLVISVHGKAASERWRR